MDNRICLVNEDDVRYPLPDGTFRPSVNYPEYVYQGELSNTDNKVYDMVRSGLYLYGLDAENYGTCEWNPLGTYIKPGDKVFIKPNLVSEKNHNSFGGVECIYTNPSLVAAVIDYTVIALQGRGEIVVGDAPVQECDFETLVDISGYERMISFYKEKEINIRLVDMRNKRTKILANGVHVLQEDMGYESNEGVTVDIGSESAFANFSESQIERLRVTNFDPRILHRHHTKKKHEYSIAKEILTSDVIINMPKPKTHRKAGMTCSLKNMIGTCSRKEYLPHYTFLSSQEGGDAYKTENKKLMKANQLLDDKNIFIAQNNYNEAERCIREHFDLLEKGKVEAGDNYWEGSWYGNDTIWRTVSDINRIVYYADENGKMQDCFQRKVFIVADMIVSGHGEGPLEPIPYNAGMIVIGEDPLCLDRTVCSIMGFDYGKIPSLTGRYLTEGIYAISKKNVTPEIISNNNEWCKQDTCAVTKLPVLHFQPARGWETALGNPQRDKIIGSLDGDKDVVIFGAGMVGKGMVSYIKSRYSHLNIVCFFDNDENKWEKEIMESIRCEKPRDVYKKLDCLIAVRDRFKKEVEEDVHKLHFAKVAIYTEE